MISQTKYLLVLLFICTTFTSSFSLFPQDRWSNILGYPGYYPTGYNRHFGYPDYYPTAYHRHFGYPDYYPTAYHRHAGSVHAHNHKHGISTSPRMARPSRASSNAARPKMVNVDDFKRGAKGGDDTEAFKKAWEEACSSGNSVLVVPSKRIYYLKPITFSGPCKPALALRLYGTIKASPSESDYKDRRYWLVFQNVNDFRVEGGGIIDGNGHVWWKKSCKVNQALPCQEAPTAVTFMDCQNIRVADLWLQDSQKMHLTFQRCSNVNVYNLQVTAPEDSPNTDGIHVTETQNIDIIKSVIRTGDDCISIVSGSKNVRAMDITCGPGHGISIGSLGAGKSAAMVSTVEVNRARLSGTSNGLRIKTWQGGKGYARDIKFQNILMHNVSNPIIIDQFYCDQVKPCKQQHSAVQISNVLFRNIKGTSASQTALNLNCSQTFPCRSIILEDVSLQRDGEGSVEASCVNVQSVHEGRTTPLCTSKNN